MNIIGRRTMNQELQEGQIVQIENSGATCQVEKFLGGGGQGEVYQVNLSGHSMALKWYFPQIVESDPRQKDRLQKAIETGAPNDRFLWPMDLALIPEKPSSYGYIMPLRESNFKSINDLMKRRIEPTFRALITASFELADSYFQLHSKGLCYRDISFGNAFFNPDTGEVRICDNDNVDVNKSPGNVEGTPRFMAPEIVRGEASPSTQTDLFSLAILLFYLLFTHHPLEGAKEQAIHSFDLPAMKKIYGREPLFIFDPNDDSNRPVPGEQDNPIIFWEIYPQFLKDLFTEAFTKGINDPENGRVRENEWRRAMIKLRDSIIYCPHCGVENFYDRHALKTQRKLNPCWSCEKEIQTPPRICFGGDKERVTMLNHDTKLFSHHIDDKKKYDFSAPVAEVTRNPKNPNLWGLRNLSGDKWVVTTADNKIIEIEPGKNVKLGVGTKINFSTEQGEIRT